MHTILNSKTNYKHPRIHAKKKYQGVHIHNISSEDYEADECDLNFTAHQKIELQMISDKDIDMLIDLYERNEVFCNTKHYVAMRIGENYEDDCRRYVEFKTEFLANENALEEALRNVIKKYDMHGFSIAKMRDYIYCLYILKNYKNADKNVRNGKKQNYPLTIPQKSDWPMV